MFLKIGGISANVGFKWSGTRKELRRLVPAYAGQDTIYQRPRLQRREDVGMSMASQYQKRPEIESFYTNMLSGVLGFPLQPIDGHTLIASWRLSLEPIFFLPSDEMAGQHFEKRKYLC
jgi:hypothetical protein